MDDEPRVNDVRLLENGEMERFNGESWEPYLEIVPEEIGLPPGLTRDDEPS